MLKFIVDTQLPPSLSLKFLKAGFDAVHTTNYINGHLMNDKEIRRIAVAENRIIVTKDSDFFDYFILRGAPPKVLLLEIGNISNSQLFSIIDTNITKIKNLFEKENTSLIILQEKKAVAY
jgi:predicted nuclease of predicted toxin-antitoxin system